jgi:hypothetical protein
MSETEMLRVDPVRAKALVSQLQSVNERVTTIAKGRAVSETISHILNQRLILVARYGLSPSPS